MILDSYFAVACVLLLAALVGVTAIAANRIRELDVYRGLYVERWKAQHQAESDANRWREAWEARDAQLAEARTRIDTLEGELTAQDISHSKAIRAARKNDHRDAKGRYAPAHDPYVNR